METVDFIYTELDNMSVALKTQEQLNLTMLHGKALVNKESRHMTFIQNSPRGPRSSEVCRTDHGRVVRRPDGKYTLTIRFDGEEKYLGETLMAELRNVVRMVKADAQLVKKHVAE